MHTWLDIPRSLITQSQRHAGHTCTKIFDYPDIRTDGRTDRQLIMTAVRRADHTLYRNIIVLCVAIAASEVVLSAQRKVERETLRDDILMVHIPVF